MLNHAANRLYNKPYDANGEIAASGNANTEMLQDLMDTRSFNVNHQEVLGNLISDPVMRIRWSRKIAI